MISLPQPSSRGRGGRRWRIAVAGPVLVALVAAPSAPALADPPGSAPSAAAPDPAAVDPTTTVTLLTGDVVGLHRGADGRQSAWLQRPATPDGDRPMIYEQDGHVHVVPAEARPYLDSGVLDDRLFNVTALVEQGYDDQSRDDLPLLLGAAPDAPAPLRAPAVPTGADPGRPLSSIGGGSVTAEKDQIRQVWESLRGPEPAALGADDAALAGADRVWLNGQVGPALDESVGHVGAPVAWEAGFDGSGTTVAVLDTGYDATHPDLAGRVRDAANFTTVADPPGQVAVDRNGHGTHVAATVAGTGAASDGARAGVAPGAELLVGKVLADTAGLDAWVIAGMEWAVEQDADVVNLSLGTDLPDAGEHPLSIAVDRLSEESDTLFVVSAGNNGPDDSTITAPGSAARALTVGATDLSDQVADFSSRGPRRPDDTVVKPEITAPGVGIVAARAAGTSAGYLIDDHYTAMDGTSMAAPHVAGAAAIAAQQHPELTGRELKSLLVANSSPVGDQPVRARGGGRLDLAATTAAGVLVSDAALSLGRVDQHTRFESRTLTYRNLSDRRVVLRLSPELTDAGGFTDDRPVARIIPGALVLPPGGEASAEVSLAGRASRPGIYTGHIVARDPRDPAAVHRTVLSATVAPPEQTVTVHATDRSGQPAEGQMLLWNAETGALGSTEVTGGTGVMEVPAGTYLLRTLIETPGDGDPMPSTTVAGHPELEVAGDVTLRYDARDADRFDVDTPEVTEHRLFRVMWHRQVGHRTINLQAASGVDGHELFLLPSEPVTTGVFEHSVAVREVEPLLTVSGTDADGQRRSALPVHASYRVPYIGEGTLPLVYAGDGTPEELAAAKVAGKAALVTWRKPGDLPRQAEAAAEAGAALLLAYNAAPDHWSDSLHGRDLLPAYRLTHADGVAFRELAEDNGGQAPVELTGVADSRYSYELSFTESGRIPTGGTRQVDGSRLAVVESDYRQDSDTMTGREWWIPYTGSSSFAVGSSFLRNGPVQRTEYVTAEEVEWQRFAQPHGEFPSLYWTWSVPLRYEPGGTYQEQWWGPLTRPGVPAVGGYERIGLPAGRFHDALRFYFPTHVIDNGRAYTTYDAWSGDVAELTVRRGGEVIAESGSPWAQVSVPAGPAEYEVELLVHNSPGHWGGTSVATESTWRFTSQRPDGESAVLPLVQLAYQLDSGSRNEVAAGEPYPLFIEPGYQPGADGPGGFGLTVEVSYDDGETWAPAPVTAGGRGFEATVPPAGPDAAFGTVRVVATDAKGNRLTQLIERGWRVDQD